MTPSIASCVALKKNTAQQNHRQYLSAIGLSITLLVSSAQAFSAESLYQGIPIKGELSSQQLVQLTSQEDEEQDSEYHGQIPVAWYQDTQDVARLALIDQTKAISLGNQTGLGKVFKAKLDEDENFLVWELTILSQQGQMFDLTLDAGNGNAIKLALSEENED